MAIDTATPEQLKELIGFLVERVKVNNDGTYTIELVPTARPFSPHARLWFKRPRTDSNRRRRP